MTGQDDKVKKLLKEALPRVEDEPEPSRDLWPGMLRRLDEKAGTPPWFDWALGAGVLGMAALFPAAIPVFLYYL